MKNTTNEEVAFSAGYRAPKEDLRRAFARQELIKLHRATLLDFAVSLGLHTSVMYMLQESPKAAIVGFLLSYMATSLWKAKRRLQRRTSLADKWRRNPRTSKHAKKNELK
jgi:hypothetical protein